MNDTKRRVLAFLDDTPVAALVRETAENVASAIGAELHVLSIDESESVEKEILRELDSDDVAFGVLGGRSIAAKPELLGHIARVVATSSRRTLIIVPPTARPWGRRDLRFLLPLDGHPQTTNAVVPVVADLLAVGAIVPVHVFDSSNVPMFFTSPEDRAVLADDFAARHFGGATQTARPLLCVGRPAEEIIAAIDREEPDAVVVCWNQQFDVGRAEVIRRLLADGRVPIVLLPADDAQ